ncbi:MAG: thioesterase [Oscillospiraceae bacterium]
MLKKDYSFKFKVSQCECDMQNRMSPGAILRRVQQISTDHCTDSGLNAEVYRATHTVFLLAKTELKLLKPIPSDTIVTVSTQAYAPVRASFLRKVTLADEAGTILAQTQSAWVLVDTETKRIVRHAPPEISKYFEGAAQEPSLFGIQKCESITDIGNVKALYTMCDVNGHINNAVYADIICNSLDAEFMTNANINRLVISYHNEAAIGTGFTVYKGVLDENSIYLLGKAQNINYFEANIYFT